MMNDNWCTPKKLYEIIMGLPRVYNDVCLPGYDCLQETNWGNVFEYHHEVTIPVSTRNFYLNPPYSRGSIEKFIDAAIYQARTYNNDSLMLLPADLSTKWSRKIWKHVRHNGHECLFDDEIDTHILFCPKRIRFEGAKGSPNFASMFVWVSINLDVPNMWKESNKILEYFEGSV